MAWLRTQLARTAACWLACHLCLLAAIPSILHSSSPAASVATHIECECDHGDGRMCPMHHTRSHSKAPSPESRPRSCQGTSNPLFDLAASLVGPSAVLVPAVSVVAHVTTIAWLPAADQSPLDAFLVLDSPPPRS
jgi:hypothetical protein